MICLYQSIWLIKETIQQFINLLKFSFKHLLGHVELFFSSFYFQMRIQILQFGAGGIVWYKLLYTTLDNTSDMCAALSHFVYACYHIFC